MPECDLPLGRGGISLPGMARTNTHTAAATVGERIRRTRLALNLSQRQLECEGVTYAYISRVEAGKRTPSISALIKLSDKFTAAGAQQMSAHYLLTGDHDGPCLMCGRHEPQEGRRNGRDH